MKEFVLTGPRTLTFRDYEEPPLKPDQVRLRLLLSGIKHGTELALYRGNTPFADKRFDTDYRIFLPAEETSPYPANLTAWDVGEIVELGAATGWWSALLATKGDLHAYDASGALLDRARRRLLAHGLRAHLHVRDPWAAPDRPVDAVVVPFLLGGAADARLASRLATVRSWLRPGGILAAISILDESAVEGVAAVDRLAAAPEELAAALRSAGFSHVECRPTGRCFLLARATAA